MKQQQKQILITESFRKRLKKLRRHFSEDDIIDNIKAFIRLGLRKGESTLTSELFGGVTFENRSLWQKLELWRKQTGCIHAQ